MAFANVWSKLATVFYVLWGVLHIQAAYLVYQLGTTVTPSMTQGRLFQGAWNLFFFAISAIAVAIMLNKRNSKLGYFANLAIVSVTDVGFIMFVLLPGYLPLWPGLQGPLYWVLGLLFSTIALRKEPAR
ncbi:hypothetical protein [Mitsuaria sp. 7]|uniref:hypothetical protein n=1 Tax=Mitsuaria sp. 7 TaxID=1658665 RepID=UPI0007DD10B2|nr:hypothetical protein [Mitsuaria sp. 7]ANH66626.1 hypothetical protein ABE85_01915 [Mitsuaria sp. 7]